MHTFFINTSPRVKTLGRHDPLFDNLRALKQLEIINCPLRELAGCAETICRMVVRDDDITDDFNVIVYAEAEGVKEHALAYETAAALHIEEALFTALERGGNMAGKALVLFGERFRRGVGYLPGGSFDKAFGQALWRLFPLPDTAAAAQIIAKTAAQFPGDASLRDYQQAAAAQLTQRPVEGGVLPPGSAYVRAILNILADFYKNRRVVAAELPAKLHEIIREQMQYGSGLLAGERIEYAHVALSDASGDGHAADRDAYRLLLFVYRCAFARDIRTLDAGGGADEYNTFSGHRTIPDIDWNALSEHFIEKLALFRAELDGVTSKEHGQFPAFNENLRNSGEVIVAISKPVPELHVKAAMHSGLTVAQLKDAVNKTIDDIQTKAESNQAAVRRFISAVMEEYGRKREEQLKRFPVTSPQTCIEDDETAEKDIAMYADEAKAAVTARAPLSMADTDVGDIIDDARARTDYLFEALAGVRLICVLGGVFTLLFAIPYAAVCFNVFAMFRGWLFFGATVAAAAAAFAGAYRLFVNVFKRKVVRALKQLCGAFAKSQEDRKQCLDAYVRLIQHDLPLCYCVRTYRIEFEAYLKNKRAQSVHVTYHKKRLSACIDYLTHLFTDLALPGKADAAGRRQADAPGCIEPDRPACAPPNDGVYALLGVADEGIFISSGSGGGARA